MLEYEANPTTKEAAKQFADSFKDVMELRSGRHKGVVLVRPDGYIAYSSHEDSTAALKHVQRLLERQTQGDVSVERKFA